VYPGKLSTRNLIVYVLLIIIVFLFQLHALVEYETIDLAEKAVGILVTQYRHSAVQTMHLNCVMPTGVTSLAYHCLLKFLMCLNMQVAELTDEHNWRSGLRVRLLLRRTVYSHNPSYTIMLMFPILVAKDQFTHSRCCMDFLA
jgi:hypothetical protein